jgi:hypothetical protein
VRIELKSIGLVLLRAVPAVGIPLLANRFKLLQAGDAIILGLVIAIFVNSVEALAHINGLRRQRVSEDKLWETKTEFDKKISIIRESHDRIVANSASTPDLFQRYFDEIIAEVANSISTVAGRNELHLERSHVVSVDALLSGFHGFKEDEFRGVHFLADNEFFFGIYAKQYFYKMYELVRKKNIKKVRRLIIYEEDSQLEEPRSIALIRFHLTNPCYDIRIMRLGDFRSLLRDYRLEVPRDFGIYAGRYVYCAVENIINNIVGYWIREPEKVQAFTRFFDRCWDSPVARAEKNINRKDRMSLEELFTAGGKTK